MIDYLTTKLFRLHLDDEKLFVHMAGVLKSGIQWEERAKELLSKKVELSDLEDAIRLFCFPSLLIYFVNSLIYIWWSLYVYIFIYLIFPLHSK